MRDGICPVVTNRTGMMILYDNPMEGTSRAHHPGGGDTGHTWLSPSTSQSFRLAGAAVPQVVALVGTFIVQLAGQAGHRGSELHHLQDLPDGFIRVLVEHVQVHSQRAREQDGVLARRDGGSELGPATPPVSARPSPGLTWGMTVILDRSVCSPTWAIGTPSIQIPPSAASTSRSRPPAREDFPAPVLPTMPTCQGMGWRGLFQPGLARRQATEGSWACLC